MARILHSLGAAFAAVLVLLAGGHAYALTFDEVDAAVARNDMAPIEAMLKTSTYPPGSAAWVMQSAGRQGKIPVLERLLALGFSVDGAPRKKPQAGETALMHAAWKGQVETVKWLLERGANPNLVGKCTDADCLGHFVMIGAVKSGSVAVMRLLLDAGADPNIFDRYATEYALREGDVPMYELLTARGGQPKPGHPYSRREAAQKAPPPSPKPAESVSLRSLGVAELLDSAPNSAPAAARRGERSRIAIIAEDSLSKVADLLTAKMSALEGIELVERQELDRVFAEQKIARSLAVDATSVGKLGGWLQADAFILIRTRQVGQSRAVETRLVRVNPGIVLDSTFEPAPIQDPAGFADQLAARLPAFAARAVEPTATAVSLLRVRASVTSAGGAELERLLPVLLAQRLSAQPGFVLLERSAMDQLSAEATAPFWKGKYLIEGSVTPQLDQSGQFDLELRLDPMNGQRPRIARAKGNRSAPGAAVDAALAQINDRNSTAATAPPAAGEAERFAEQARQALILRLNRPASEAAECCSWESGALP